MIAGAGIAGLASAIALARVGLRPIVLERAEAPYELGAGLQLSPNAVRCLKRLGLGPALARIALHPRALEIRNAASARRLAVMPLGAACSERFGAPYCLIARPALHRLLTEAALSAGAKVRYGSELQSCVIDGSGAVLNIAGDSPMDAIGLIGADGQWSTARRFSGNRTRPRPTPLTAWRSTLPPPGTGPGHVPSDLATVWLAPNLHAVTYPIDAAGTTNLVVVAEAESTAEGWDNLAGGEALAGQAATFAPPLSDIILSAPAWRSWPLFDSVPSPLSPTGAVTLVGDAAHPMLPFLAQGAGMAIEDALVLADAVAGSRQDLAGAFRAYEARRHARVWRVVRGARRNGRIFHLGWPLVPARDLVLRALSGKAMLARQDWLYAGGPASRQTPA